MDSLYLPPEVLRLIAISLRADHSHAALCSLLTLSHATRTALLPLVYTSLEFPSDDSLHSFLSSHLPTSTRPSPSPALDLVRETTLHQFPSHRTASLVLAAVPALPHQRIFPSATHLEIPLQALLDLPVPPSTSYNAAKAVWKQRQALLRLLDAQTVTFLPSPRDEQPQPVKAIKASSASGSGKPIASSRSWKCRGVLLDNLRQRGGSEDWIRDLSTHWAGLQDVYWETRPPGLTAEKVVEGVRNHLPSSREGPV